MSIFHSIYLDMDGPIADFALEAFRAHLRAGRQLPHIRHYGSPLSLTSAHLLKYWPMGTSIHKYLLPNTNLGDDYWSPSFDSLFWKPIRHDPLFWQHLSKHTWTDSLIKMLKGYTKHLVIATTPDNTAHSYAGKKAWLDLNGFGHLELITIKHKWRLADPQSLLIDDYAKHVQSWCAECERRFEKPGSAILFPAVWNENHPWAFRPLEYVENMINGFLQTG